jgi:hypothetical protein
MKDYQKSTTVNNTAAAVYNALTQHIPDWWSDDFKGAAAKQGDQFHIAFGGTKKTFEIAEIIPDQKITWLCLKAYIDMDKLTKKDEWIGTRVIWTITTEKNGAVLTILHQGLNESVECYSVCEPAWDYFLNSIQLYLTTGAGTPYRMEKASLEWEASTD